jgi:hypothetical protein
VRTGQGCAKRTAGRRAKGLDARGAPWLFRGRPGRAARQVGLQWYLRPHPWNRDGFDQSRGGGYFRTFDATQYPEITVALVRRGCSEARLRKILGHNWVRLFDAVQAVTGRGPR